MDDDAGAPPAGPSPREAAAAAAASTSLGKNALPMARVRRIIRIDPDTLQCSNQAMFAAAKATELFIAYFCEKAHETCLADRKKQITYRHMAEAVARVDSLEFLADVVPRTQAYRTLNIAKDRAHLVSKQGTSQAKVQLHVEADVEMVDQEQEQ